jgi:hypothetical protein
MFDCRIEETFIPELRKRREAFENVEPAVILIDNCSGYLTSRLLQFCESERVIL